LRPPHSGRLDATYAFGNGRGSITSTLAYNGQRDDLAFGLPNFNLVRVSLDDYWLATIAARYRLADGVEAFGRVENALDATYQEVYGFASAGIAAYAGLKLTLGGEAGIGANAKAK
jgi:vitamin B12 transporter